MLAKSEYALGHSDRELERLQLQADCLEALTRRLIRESGLKPGMRVVDIGCGAGDVAMLIAEFVGVTGEVVAIDMAERAVETASRRAQAKGFKRIKFVIGTDESLRNLHRSMLRSDAVCWCISGTRSRWFAGSQQLWNQEAQ